MANNICLIFKFKFKYFIEIEIIYKAIIEAKL